MRYLRQESLDFIPNDFQKTIANKKLIIVGCGGIGSVLSEILLRGGFLNLKLIDFDKVDLTNLQRQIYVESDINKFKVDSLKKRLLDINSKAKIKVVKDKLTNENIDVILEDCDLIIDATDNFEIRFLIDNFCQKNNLDWLYNGAIKTQVISGIFRGKKSQFQKIFKNSKDEKCFEVGILTSTTYSSASLAYNNIIKYFLLKNEDKKNKDNKYKDENKNEKNTIDYKDKLIKIDLFTNKIFEIDLE